ncbi:hypothetical protein OH77DRAFT_1593959 [Trametes cingulata]|nr:hypothetical protein OH77DRAFT_1593959 [Trametes cingulata]
MNPAPPPPHSNPQPRSSRSASSSSSSQNPSAVLHAFLQQADPPPDNAIASGSLLQHDSRHLATTPSAQSSSANSPQSNPSVSHSKSSATSLDADSPPSRQTRDSESSASKSKKARVQLAPDQPLTTHGKPRERVFVACVQCRTRKVRCDGGKPECYNCSRRADVATDPCSYDPAPRRRGKDRTPGSRKLAPYIPKKTRTTRSRLEEEAKRKKAAADPAPGPGPSRQVTPAAASGSGSGTRPVRTVRDSAEPPPPGVPPFLAQTAPADFAPDAYLLDPSGLVIAPEPRFVVLEEEQPPDESEATLIANEPSVQFTRETWWDALLALYASPLSDHPSHPSHPHPHLHPPGALPVDVRARTTERIAADLRFLFRASVHWMSFVNIPRFFAALFNPLARHALQPSLVLAALGLATFWQSSEAELGRRGREKALRLIDQAHATFDASVNAGWIDVGLVQAAWMLAFFEIQAHPQLSTHRTRQGMATLDALIRCLSLTTLDIDDPRATVFVPQAVPAVRSTPPSVAPAPSPYDPWSGTLLPHAHPHPHPAALPSTNAPPSIGTARGIDGVRAPPGAPPAIAGARGVGLAPPPPPPPPLVPQEKWQCGCQAYSLGYNWPLARDLAPQWAETPMWPKNASAGEMMKEECRRLVWSSVMLTATHNTKSTAGTDWETHHLWMKDPSNYALLFPGENLASAAAPSGVPSSKDSVWALYMRTLLLWHSCLRMRCDLTMGDAERAQFAMGAWLEIDTIEALLDRHTCMVETGFLMQVRDVLFNTRMCVSHEFQRYIPEATTAPTQLFYHAKAEKWMMNQLRLAMYFRHSLQNPKADANDHSRRNFLMFWFMSQITRALKLWEADRTLTIALDVARAFAPCTEALMLLWPSPSQRREYEQLHSWLVHVCISAGVSPPERAIGFDGTGLS